MSALQLMDERDFFNEKQETKRASFLLHHIRAEALVEPARETAQVHQPKQDQHQANRKLQRQSEPWRNGNPE